MPEADAPPRPSLARGLTFASSSFVVTAVVVLVSSVVTSRIYGIEVIGQHALTSAPYLMTTMLSSVNERAGAVRRLATMTPRTREASGLFFAVLAFSSALTAVVGSAVLAVSVLVLQGPLDGSSLIGPAAVLLIAYVGMGNISWNLDAVYAGFGAARELFVVRASQVVTFLVASVALATVSRSVWALTWATVLSLLVPFAERLWFSRRYLDLRPGRDAVREGVRELGPILRFGLVLLPGTAAQGAISQLDVWLLGTFRSVASVGAYSRAYTIAARLDEAGFRIVEILSPHTTRMWANGDREGAASAVHRSLRAALVPLALLVAIGAGVAPDALAVFGDGFERAATAFGLLIAARVLFVLCAIQAGCFVAVGRPSVTSALNVMHAVLAATGMVLLGDRFGSSGVAAGWFLAFAIQFLLLTRLLPKMIFPAGARSLTMLDLGRVLGATGAALIAARVIADRLPMLAGIVVGAVAASIVYGGLLLALGALHEEERALARTTIGRLLGR